MSGQTGIEVICGAGEGTQRVANLACIQPRAAIAGFTPSPHPIAETSSTSHRLTPA